MRDKIQSTNSKTMQFASEINQKYDTYLGTNSNETYFVEKEESKKIRHKTIGAFVPTKNEVYLGNENLLQEYIQRAVTLEYAQGKSILSLVKEEIKQNPNGKYNLSQEAIKLAEHIFDKYPSAIIQGFEKPSVKEMLNYFIIAHELSHAHFSSAQDYRSRMLPEQDFLLISNSLDSKLDTPARRLRSEITADSYAYVLTKEKFGNHKDFNLFETSLTQMREIGSVRGILIGSGYTMLNLFKDDLTYFKNLPLMNSHENAQIIHEKALAITSQTIKDFGIHIEMENNQAFNNAQDIAENALKQQIAYSTVNLANSNKKICADPQGAIGVINSCERIYQVNQLKPTTESELNASIARLGIYLEDTPVFIHNGNKLNPKVKKQSEDFIHGSFSTQAEENKSSESFKFSTSK